MGTRIARGRGAVFRIGLLAATAGCGDWLTVPNRVEEDRVIVIETGVEQLFQSVRVSRTDLAIGDTIWMRSVVVNKGPERIVDARICGMDIVNLTLDPYGPRCAGSSMRGVLATGDSVWTLEGGVLVGEAGERHVRIRHLLDPEHWVGVDLVVR